MTSEIIDEDSILNKLDSNNKLIIKFGADPTRPDLHLGHSVALRGLRIFQELGHEIVFVIGDYTAMIGDPSGKSKTRVSLSYEETRKSAETYYQQVTKILDKNKTRIVFNSDWLGKLSFENILELTSKYTVDRHYAIFHLSDLHAAHGIVDGKITHNHKLCVKISIHQKIN